MTADPLPLARSTVRLWTRLYTSGLPPHERDRRLAEIESELWESIADAERHGIRPARIAADVLLRALRGSVDDLSWRLEVPMRAPTRAVVWITAVGMIAAVAWIAYVAAPATLPVPAPIRTYVPAPPPPPPPPPPSNMRSRRIV